MKKILILTTVILITLSSDHTYAVIEEVSFTDQQTEQRYKDLIAELRCLVCQNQNLADSDADLAKDLRRKTVEMLKAGASDDEILNYMRDRYGDFVLYRPRFSGATAILWVGPLVLLIGVLIGIIFNIRRRQKDELLISAHADNQANTVKVRNLLRDAPDLTPKSNKSDH